MPTAGSSAVWPNCGSDLPVMVGVPNCFTPLALVELLPPPLAASATATTPSTTMTPIAIHITGNDRPWARAGVAVRAPDGRGAGAFFGPRPLLGGPDFGLT